MNDDEHTCRLANSAGHILRRVFNCTKRLDFNSLPRKISYDLLKQIVTTFTFTKIFDDPFLVIYTRNFLFLPRFFGPPSYKGTTTTAQFTLYNCKFDFTTAEIVTIYTLKYAQGYSCGTARLNSNTHTICDKMTYHDITRAGQTLVW